jgi:hypothetical protein
MEAMNETLQGLYAGLMTKLAVAAVANNTWFEPSTQAWLVTLGAANELLGVRLVASPELIGRVQLVWRLLRRHVHAVLEWLERKVRKLLRLGGRVYVDAGTVTATMTGSSAHSQPSSPSDHGTAVPRLKIRSSASLPGHTPILSLSG